MVQETRTVSAWPGSPGEAEDGRMLLLDGEGEVPTPWRQTTNILEESNQFSHTYGREAATAAFTKKQ